MKLDKSIECPSCHGKNFTAKYESTYVYSYKINTPDNDKRTDKEGPLPFLFDNREQKGAKQYIECEECGTKYPCSFSMDSQKIDFTIVRKAIRGDHVETPEFFG